MLVQTGLVETKIAFFNLNSIGYVLNIAILWMVMIDFIESAKNHLAIGENENITDFKTKHFSFMNFYWLKIRLNNVYSIKHYNYKNDKQNVLR